MPVTPVQPEAPDNLLEVLKGASIDEEHRTIMSAVVQKVQSAKSGLTKACTSLLTGFEVSKECVNNITALTVAPDALFGIQEEKLKRGSNKIRRSLTKRSQYAYAGFSAGIRRTDCGSGHAKAEPRAVRARARACQVAA